MAKKSRHSKDKFKIQRRSTSPSKQFSESLSKTKNKTNKISFREQKKLALKTNNWRICFRTGKPMTVGPGPRNFEDRQLNWVLIHRVL